MGVSSSKSSNKPIYAKEIGNAANTLNSTYQANAPKVQGIADTLTGLVPGMAEKYQAGNPALNAASGYVTDTLAGDGTNPNIDAWVGQQQDATSNALGAKLAKMGLNPAGSTYQGLQARELGKVALGARMDDWNNAQARKAQAAGMAPGIAAGEVSTIAPMLATAQLGANLPMENAYQYAMGTGGLLGQYQQQKQSPSLASSIGKGIQVAGQVASMFSDARLKEDIRKVGATDDGLSIYTYRYKGDNVTQMGVMAQEVEAQQPEALGPTIGGYMTVNYAEVR